MKNVTRIIVSLVLLFSAPITSYTQIIIGTGTTTSQQPLNYWYGHGRHAAIYTASEMNTSSTGGTITTLSWYSNSTSGQNTGPTVIRLKEVGTTTTFTASAVYSTTISGATQVYSGTPATPVNGWNVIDITDFTLNAGQNLMVIVEADIASTVSCSGTGTSTSNSWRYTAGSNNTAATWQYDDTGTFPACTPGTIPTATRSANRPNITLGGLVPPSVPGCATLSTPANGATGVVRNTPLTWTAPTTGGTPTGYKVYLGTATNPALVTTVTYPTATYTPSGQAYSTTYYWRIVPTNATGDATGCTTEYSYTTEAPPPPPANDACANATTLVCNAAAISGTTVNAVAETAPPGGCIGQYGVWYTFTGDGSIVTLSTTAGSGFDHEMDVFSGSCGSLTNITCQDVGGSGGTESYTFTAANAVQYYIYIAHYSTTATSTQTGTFNIGMTCTTPPAVPGCATLNTPANGATGVVRNTPLTWTAPTTGGTPTGYKVYLGTATNPALVTTVTYPTATYTPSGQAYSTTYYWRIVPTNATGDAVGCTTEYSYTTDAAPVGALCTNPAIVSSFPYSSSGTTCGFGNDYGIQCSGNYGGGEDYVYQLDIATIGSYTINVTATGGGSYIGWFLKGSADCATGSACLSNAVSSTGTVASGSYNFTSAGTYFLIIDTWPSPNCSAYTISITPPAPIPGCAASLNTPANGATGVVRNTPLTWSAPTTGGTPTGYKVYLGTATNPSLVTTVTYPTTTYTPSGQAYSTTYYWRIVPTNGTGDAVGCTTEYSYTTEAAPPPPANDNSTGAIELFQGTSCTNVAGTTANATQSIPAILCSGFTGNADDDVWYKFIAATPDPNIAVTTTTDVVLQLFGPDATTSIACMDDAVTGPANETLIASGLTPGETYYVRVYSYAASTTATFNICVNKNPTSVAGGVANSCQPTTPFTIKSTGSGQWLYCIHSNGLVAAFKDDQNMGNVTIQYRTSSTTRVVGGITYVNRDITITPAVQPGGAIPVRLYYTNSELTTAGLTIGALGCSKTANSCGDAPVLETILQQTGNGTVGSTGVYAEFSVSSFSTFYAASYAALPLELASFTGKALSTSNMLQWETLTEKNVQSHIVERSIDGIKWTEIGRKAGQLDSHTSLKYELEDRTPLAKAYYRLRSVDFDGQENLSNSIVLTRKGDHFGITAAFPSPAKDRITVQFASTEETTVRLKVTDLSGRTVLEQEFAAANGINEVPVDLASLQSGLYLVSILNETATTAPVRIVKE